MTPVTVVRTYLELLDRRAARLVVSDDSSLRLVRAASGSVELFRAMYRAVGSAYHWRDRLALTDAQLRTYLEQPTVELWVLHHDTEPVGFFELRRHDDGSVEITYFGILERFFGRGLGKHLLSCAVERAWSIGTSRVWVHTCTLDSPAALPNYLARGFRRVREESYVTDLP